MANIGTSNHILLDNFFPMKYPFFSSVFCILFAVTLQAQNRLSTTGTATIDTLKSNQISLLGGKASELVMSNGTKLPAASAAGLILTSTSLGTPTWVVPPSSLSTTFSLLTQADIGSGQSGLGVNTSSPNALLFVNANGYEANNIFTVSSSEHVTPTLNTNGGANWVGYVIAKNNDEKWYIGMPGNTNAQPVNNLIIKNTTGTRSPGVGINKGGAVDALLAVNGSVRAKGIIYNSRSGTGSVNLTENDDYYFLTSNSLSNVTVNLPSPSSSLTGKRLNIMVIGSGSGSGTIGCNPTNASCFALNTNVVVSTQTLNYGKSYAYICDGYNWYPELNQ